MNRNRLYAIAEFKILEGLYEHILKAMLSLEEVKMGLRTGITGESLIRNLLKIQAEAQWILEHNSAEVEALNLKESKLEKFDINTVEVDSIRNLMDGAVTFEEFIVLKGATVRNERANEIIGSLLMTMDLSLGIFLDDLTEAFEENDKLFEASEVK